MLRIRCIPETYLEEISIFLGGIVLCQLFHVQSYHELLGFYEYNRLLMNAFATVSDGGRQFLF